VPPSVLRKRLPTWSWWTMYHPHSQAKQSRKQLYLCPAPPLGFPHSMCPMMRTSLSLLPPPSNLRPLIKVLARSLALPRGSSHRHLLLATLTLHPHRHRLLPSRCQLKRPPNLVSLRNGSRMAGKTPCIFQGCSREGGEAERQAKLQQALKENLNILFFDKVMLVYSTFF